MMNKSLFHFPPQESKYRSFISCHVALAMTALMCVFFTQNTTAQTYCTTRGTAPWQQWLERVSVANASGSSNFPTTGKEGYGNFTNPTPANLLRSAANLITITPNSSWVGDPVNSTLYWSVWIDYNGDGDFLDADENVTNRKVNFSNGLFLDNDFTFAVPATARLGITRLRVALKVGAAATPCETFDKGEVEDYTVNITSIGSGLPDLVAQHRVKNTLFSNARLSIALDLVSKNKGTAPTAATVVKYYISHDSVLTNASSLVTTLNIPPLAPNDTFWIDAAFAAPDTFIVDKKYYIIGIIDPNNTVLESNESNNTCSTGHILKPSTGLTCSQGIAPWEFWVANVQLNTLNNTSGQFKDILTLGYSDYTNLTTTVNKGQTYPLSISAGLSWIGNLPNTYCRVWIDFNHNNIFETTEVVLEKTNQNPFTQSLLIPTTASTGTTRMRVALKNGAYPAACEIFDKGEVEDYVFQIAEGTTGNPSDIVLSMTSTPSVYRRYSTHNFKITAVNTGTTAFTNVKIKFTRPDLTVNGGSKVASIGTFQDYCPNNIECSEWTIPTLAGGATATLDVPIYILIPTGAITATANLLSSTPTDNVVANNTASVTVNQGVAPIALPLIIYKPTQLLPIVIQKLNPTIADGEIDIELESLIDKTIDFNLFNSMGQLVLAQPLALEKGLNKVALDVSKLPQGLYFIQTNVGKGRDVPTKFIKL